MLTEKRLRELLASGQATSDEGYVHERNTARTAFRPLRRRGVSSPYVEAHAALRQSRSRHILRRWHLRRSPEGPVLTSSHQGASRFAGAEAV